MKRYIVSVIGDIGFGEPVYNGQTAKTRDYLHYLSIRYGKDKVNSVDTRYWRKHLLKKSLLLLKAVLLSKNLVLELGKNGRRTILPFTLAIKGLTKTNILFSIVGGSLMYDYDNEPETIKCLYKTSENYVETKTFQKFLEDKGVPNVKYSPVFSKRATLNDYTFIDQSLKKPYKFCTYARVCKEKGITSAIEAVKAVNELSSSVICTLDIYGVPQDDYKEEFERLLLETKDFVRVYPYLDDSNAIMTLAEHYMMLFPTYYSGEGFPIAIVECLKSGVPVIASDWHFNSEVVIDGVTGMVYSLETQGELIRKIKYAISNPEEIHKMKFECLKRSEEFEPNRALSVVYQRIDSHS